MDLLPWAAAGAGGLYVDLYIEDVHAGPFTVRVPVGDKTYNFLFGPEVTTFEIPKEN